jgi:hypothetical protein
MACKKGENLKGNGKGIPNRPEGPEGGRGIALLFLDLGTKGVGG